MKGVEIFCKAEEQLMMKLVLDEVLGCGTHLQAATDLPRARFLKKFIFCGQPKKEANNTSALALALIIPRIFQIGRT